MTPASSMTGSGPASKTKYGLSVENVSSRTGWQDLKHWFRLVVKVANAEAHQDVRGRNLGVLLSARF